jgi:light-regulated signal transduction histidine kinase (bacteriophytochrome)
VDAVRALTGYDRVMAYRLDEGAGVVVAEARDARLPTFLHHYFPGSDIPRQACALYVRNRVRVIPDVSYRPAPLVWDEGAAPPEPLDMSDSVLRSVSPVHVQYLGNMGVGASASISIVVDGELWGLIACHHHAPRAIGYVERELGKHVGQLLSQQIAVHRRTRAQLETVRLAQKRDETLSLIAGLGPIGDALLRHARDVARLLPADGVAILAGDEIETAGVTPPRERLAALADAMAANATDGIFATDSLAGIWPEAADYAAQASGALFCDVRDDSGLVFLWFRAEQVETVNWAGNPHKPVGPGEAGPLSPRKSFELWSEQVRHRARPWSAAELAGARAFGNGVADALQQEKLRELNRQLRKTLSDREDLIAQKDLLMREVNHRVQNSLQLVNSMLYLQAKESESDEVRTHFELARQRLTAVAMVHRRLWRTDKIGDVRLDTFLAELADELIQIWGEAWTAEVEVQADPVTLPTDKGIVLGLVLTELLTNAVKYAYGGAPGAIRLEARATGRDELAVTVSDRGVGLKAAAPRKSFGSKLIETLTRQLRGRLTTEDNHPGTKVTLTFSV